MAENNVLLLGFGDISQRLASRLITQPGYQVVGVKRNPIEAGEVPVLLADCCDKNRMRDILADHYDVIVMSFTPGEISDEGYQAAYVETTRTIIDALNYHQAQPRLLLFVSSTSVYGQRDGQWVDESSPTEPNSFSGKRLLEAEQQLAESGYAYSCVRFSGIYGPGRRRLIDQVIAGKGSPSEPILYSNRIHADDCAGILAHLMSLESDTIAPLYLATDCEPVPLHHVKEWIAERLSLPATHLQQVDTPQRLIRSSKRCSNQRILEAGYEFIYPTFTAGYQALLDEIE